MDYRQFENKNEGQYAQYHSYVAIRLASTQNRCHAQQRDGVNGQHKDNTQQKTFVTKELIMRSKTRPCNIQSFFSPVKIENFIKKFDIFLIFVQNIDCGYT